MAGSTGESIGTSWRGSSVFAGRTALPRLPWWWLAVVGIVSVAFGVVVLAWPRLTLYVFAIAVGIWLLAVGAARMVGAFTHHESGAGAQVLSGVLGLLYIFAGIICLRHLGISLLILAILVAVQWLLTGVLDLVAASSGHPADRTWLIVSGVLALLLGVAFLAVPALSLSVLVLFVGVSAIVLGVVQLVASWRLRRLQHA